MKHAWMRECITKQTRTMKKFIWAWVCLEWVSKSDLVSWNTWFMSYDALFILVRRWHNSCRMDVEQNSFDKQSESNLGWKPLKTLYSFKQRNPLIISSKTHPLNLSISLSGGKESNSDSPSSGERRGTSSGLKSVSSRILSCSLCGRSSFVSSIRWKSSGKGCHRGWKPRTFDTCCSQ